MSPISNHPAFPVSTADERTGHQDGPNTWQFTGLSIRDYFAAKAMQALISKEDKDFNNRGAKAVPLMAQWAYEYADAMLVAREAK